MSLNSCMTPFRSEMNSLQSLLVPCGKCPACINAKKKDWITRCFFESRSHDSSIFVTLTYEDCYLPVVEVETGKYLRTLNPKHMTDFLKRLRNFMSKKYNRKIRYFYSGEYGSKTKRPHYHILIFGADLHHFLSFDSANPSKLLNNKMDEIWCLGNTKVEEFKPSHARYVVGYVSKKLGDYSDFLHPKQHKEFIRMSTRPALGTNGLQSFARSLIDSNSPFAKYYPTKHLGTLKKYFLKRLFPDYKTFPNTLFYTRGQKDGLKGSFSIIDLESLSDSEVSSRIQKFKERKYSFFRFDRKSSEIICNVLHPDLNDLLESSILNYVLNNSDYLDDKTKDFSTACDYFTEGNDLVYSSYLNGVDDDYVSTFKDYSVTSDFQDNIKSFIKANYMAEQQDTH